MLLRGLIYTHLVLRIYRRHIWLIPLVLLAELRHLAVRLSCCGRGVRRLPSGVRVLRLDSTRHGLTDDYGKRSGRRQQRILAFLHGQPSRARLQVARRPEI